MRKQSIRRGVWRIGRRQQQQTGRFFPLASLADPIIGGVASNLWSTTKKKIGERDNDDDDIKMMRDNILLRKYLCQEKSRCLTAELFTPNMKEYLAEIYREM